MEIWDVNAFTSSSEVMTVTELIFMNITFIQQLFLMNSHNEFHENLTNGSVTDKQATDGHGVHIWHLYFLKNA